MLPVARHHRTRAPRDTRGTAGSADEGVGEQHADRHFQSPVDLYVDRHFARRVDPQVVRGAFTTVLRHPS